MSESKETKYTAQLLYDNLSVNQKGNLEFAGIDTVDLAEKYGTPLYLLDEDRVRKNCRIYTGAISKYFGKGSFAMYAGKALSFKGIYPIVQQEGMAIDVVSVGELYTALSAGFPADRMFFHGSSKTDADIHTAIDSGIGYFMADNREELEEINNYASQKGIKQKIILRVTPGIDPDTFDEVNTGRLDCQFGVPLEDGTAEKCTEQILKMENVQLEGFHCHIGSQIFEAEPYFKAVKKMLKFSAGIKERLGYTARLIDLGGGFGVRYVDTDPFVDIDKELGRIARCAKQECSILGIDMPDFIFEPGRSIVGDAGMTLYTVQNVKPDRGGKNYVSVDGGMTDNPRYALYKSAYTLLMANKAAQQPDFKCTVAGRCCESGAIIQENVNIKTPVRGDKLAVFTTGAYNFSMASSYNRVARPPLVIISGGSDRIAVKRQTSADIISLDI